ncbi:zinc-binding dehydrogenase [Parvibaculum sp.]|jgi:threonine dehydrogenase-like Zn-dependent dehydrogenase|uniref:zinc-dependent alcohol dehydrogenase n=1 Tax=Parvibaculum sp. TaxID=2024848 RepID=UPI001AD45F3D|nr:zinc-binding dehydrogenase [Alphaproteobacteria bacterium]
MLPKKSMAMVQTAPRKLEARDLPIPQIADDSAILRIEACGICGSDYEQYEGALRTPMPVIPGHEPLGIIEAIGDKAARRWGVDVGDRVAIETMLSCHCCDTCVGGHYHLCDRRQIYSYIPLTEAPGLWGAYSQYMYLAPNTILHKMDKNLPAELAVMFNPLGAGFRWAVEIPQTQVGDTVLIFGPGQRGLASVVAAREAGAGKIIVTGLAADSNKLQMALALGADHIIDVQNENVVDRVRALTNGKGADVIVEVTSYATQPVRDALDCIRMGGTVVLAGVKGFKPVPDFVSDLIVMKEITIKGAIGVTSSGYKKAIEMIERRKYPLELMHTHNFELEEAELAIKTLARQIEGQESVHSCLIPVT